MIEQRVCTVAYNSLMYMYVGSLKGLKKGGTRREGRQDKIGDEIILSRDYGYGNLAPVSFTESRRLCLCAVLFCHQWPTMHFSGPQPL